MKEDALFLGAVIFCGILVVTLAALKLAQMFGFLKDERP